MNESPDRSEVNPSPIREAVTLAPAAAPSEQATLSHAGAAPTPAAVGGAAIVPGYEILDVLGRGGMGVVYRARHSKLDRVVALKMILAGGHADEADLARFKTEAESVARLQHPHIVQIFEVGEHAGLPFFSLEYCPGGSLDKKLNGTPLPPNEAAALVEKLARAMQAAHDKGVVHRDLKPANVLLADDGELKITDFGLAKKLDADAGQTRTGAVMGTPSYMAPEQAGGKTAEMGPACDTYALGAILYECLTGRPPFKAATALDTMMQVVADEPVSPRQLQSKTPRDLETICLKCLEKQPGRRYGTALELADDLERYLNGESIRARTFSMIDRISWTLEHSQYDVQFGSYGAMLYWFAAIVLVTQITKHVLMATGVSITWVSVVQSLQFGLIGVVFWCYRGRTLAPSTTAERQLWSVWISYIVASLLIAAASWRLFSERQMYQMVEYPFFAITAGMAFFFLGSSYWGWCYAFGMAFFAASVVMLFDTRWAVLEFGAVWTACLLIFGTRLRGLALTQPPSRRQ